MSARCTTCVGMHYTFEPWNIFWHVWRSLYILLHVQNVLLLLLLLFWMFNCSSMSECSEGPDWQNREIYTEILPEWCHTPNLLISNIHKNFALTSCILFFFLFNLQIQFISEMRCLLPQVYLMTIPNRNMTQYFGLQDTTKSDGTLIMLFVERMLRYIRIITRNKFEKEINM